MPCLYLCSICQVPDRFKQLADHTLCRFHVGQHILHSVGCAVFAVSVAVQPQIGFRICIKTFVILFHVVDQTFKAASLHSGRKEEILSGRSELGKLKDDDILVLMLLCIHMPSVCLCTLYDFFYNLVYRSHGYWCLCQPWHSVDCTTAGGLF